MNENGVPNPDQPSPQMDEKDAPTPDQPAPQTDENGAEDDSNPEAGNEKEEPQQAADASDDQPKA